MKSDALLKNRKNQKSPVGKGLFFNDLKMKKGSLLILIAVFICVGTIKAQSYGPLAVQRINDLIANYWCPVKLF